MGLLLTLTMTTYAQRAKAVRTTIKAVTTQPATHATLRTFINGPYKVSAQLSKRAKRTFKQAQHLEKELYKETILASLHRDQASRYIISPLNIETLDELYPHMKGILSTANQLNNYFLSQNNRQILKYATDETAHLLLLQQNIEYLKQTQVRTPKKIQREMQWLTKQIPANTDYLLLGEIHDIPEIYTSLMSLAQELRKKFGKRPIIWVTEFLPESMTPDTLDERTKQMPMPIMLLKLWTTLKAKQIPVIGLEPWVVFATDKKEATSSFKNYLHHRSLSIWETWEGIRIRNEFWEKQIAEIRAQNPKALIILHAGFGHLNYTLPHSIGAKLRNKGRTFNVSLVPGYSPLYQTETIKALQQIEELAPLPCPTDGFIPVSMFDIVTRGNFPQQALQFGPADWYITGFDVQLKIPATPKSSKQLEE